MIKPTQKQQKIIAVILEKGVSQSSAIHKELIKTGENISLITVKRTLSDMTKEGLLLSHGLGRSANYTISSRGRTLANIDPKKYCAIEPDMRYGLDHYNFEYFAQLPIDIFDETELKKLADATKNYQQRIQHISPTIQKKELERLIIELSWKSSKIEGNTYTLLDTEKLIIENKEAKGHSKQESQMIINHKEAFLFLKENLSEYKTLQRSNIEKLHSILIKNLDVKIGYRNAMVGVTGSKYKPLDNIHQIREAMDDLSFVISQAKTPYEKALLILAGISYIQPFEDGNKRTARLMANAILLAYHCAPLSYRSVSENDYREATLVFYELNSLIPFKNIFIDQYEFSAKNYTVK